MTSPVTKAMIESYALMLMVMGSFFLYFCGMVWAFCNPKLSGAEEECGAAEPGDDSIWVCSPNPERGLRCSCTHLPAPPFPAEGLAHNTYVMNMWTDTDSLLLPDGTALSRPDRGVINLTGPPWEA